MTLKHHKKIVNTKYYKIILAFMFLVLYSPNEPEHFLDFFTSWIRIQEAYLYADLEHWIKAKFTDPCGSGSNPCYLRVFGNCKQTTLNSIIKKNLSTICSSTVGTQSPEFKAVLRSRQFFGRPRLQVARVPESGRSGHDLLGSAPAPTPG